MNEEDRAKTLQAAKLIAYWINLDPDDKEVDMYATDILEKSRADAEIGNYTSSAYRICTATVMMVCAGRDSVYIRDKLTKHAAVSDNPVINDLSNEVSITGLVIIPMMSAHLKATSREDKNHYDVFIDSLTRDMTEHVTGSGGKLMLSAIASAMGAMHEEPIDADDASKFIDMFFDIPINDRIIDDKEKATGRIMCITEDKPSYDDRVAAYGQLINCIVTIFMHMNHNDVSVDEWLAILEQARNTFDVYRQLAEDDTAISSMCGLVTMMEGEQGMSIVAKSFGLGIY